VVVGVGRSSLSGAEGAAGKMFNFPINIDFFPRFKIQSERKAENIRVWELHTNSAKQKKILQEKGTYIKKRKI